MPDNDWTLLVPSASDTIAFWAVHEPTGTTIAIIEGGAGGGALPGGGGRAPSVELAEDLAYLYSLSGLSGDVWLNLEVAKAKQIAYATSAIATMGSALGVRTRPAYSPESAATSFVCGEVQNAIVSGFPPALQRVIATYNRLASARGWPAACP